MVQRKVDVHVSNISQKQRIDPSKIMAEQGGWRVSDVTVGYLTQEAVAGGTITIAVGFTNLTEFDVSLRFANSQRISISIVDTTGHELYHSTPGSGTGLTEVIKSTQGTYWTEKVVLDAHKFKPGKNYTIHATLSCDFVCAASIVLTLP